VGLERGPLSLVRTTEELLGRNSSGSGLENRDWRRGGPVELTMRHPLSANVGTHSPANGGRSVGIVRSRTKAMEVFYLYIPLVCKDGGDLGVCISPLCTFFSP
jgi:hypothetical protein